MNNLLQITDKGVYNIKCTGNSATIQTRTVTFKITYRERKIHVCANISIQWQKRIHLRRKQHKRNIILFGLKMKFLRDCMVAERGLSILKWIFFKVKHK